MSETDVRKRVPVLSLFADVREGEAVNALLLTMNVFVLLCAYYLLKVAREPLILAGGGAEVKSYAAAGQSLILVVVSQLYGALAARLERIRLITSVTLFFVANLAVFVVLVNGHVSIGVPFYLWVGIFNLMVVAQFWAFAADLYSSEQGKRLFPVLGIGSSVGAIAGSTLAKKLVVLGPQALMFTAACMLGSSLIITVIVNRRFARPAIATRGGVTDEAPKEEPLDKTGGLKLLFSQRYLVAIAAMTLLINVVNSTGEYLLDRTLLASAPAEAAARGIPIGAVIGAFKADYFTAVNACVVVLQLFVVSRVIKHLGLTFALAVVPIISLTGYMTLWLMPVLSVIFYAKVAENSLDYSLQNTARQTLWLVTSRTAKYKAKAIIDTFFVRVGDVLSAGVVLLGVKLSLGTSGLAPLNMVLVAVWLGCALVVAREYVKRTKPAPEAAALASPGAEAT